MSAPRPLRFCMLTTFYPPWSFGGDGIQVQRLSEALAERGHDVTVVHSTEAYRTLAHNEPADESRPGPVRVVPIDAGRGALSPLATYLTGRPLLTRRALAAALAERFDVLHFHNPSLLGGPALLGMGNGLKLYTLHEQWLVCPTHVLWKYRRRVCERPDCVRCTLSYGRPPQPWRWTGVLERYIGELDALIAPSAAAARLHERFRRLVPLERLDHFLPDPGAGQARAESTEAGADGAPYFLFAGRLERIKCVDRLIEAFRVPRGADLVIAGTGTDEGRLRNLARGAERVRFLGWVDQARLDRLYRGALALILPTIGHESFPLVLLEAFARGVPVVTRAFSAQGELVEESGGGLVFGSARELGEAIERLARDASLRRELGESGRAAYERRWTPAAHMEAYFGLIARLARARGDDGLAQACAG